MNMDPESPHPETIIFRGKELQMEIRWSTRDAVHLTQEQQLALNIAYAKDYGNARS